MIDRLQQKVLLSSYSTFGIGGEAAFFLSCKRVEDLRDGVAWAKEKHLPVLVIGHGSNCLFPDEGVSGLVLHNAIQSFEDCGNGSFVVGAGYSFSLLGLQTAKQGYSGLEFAAGIPGTLGGALFMNAGAHGQEVSSSLTFVDILEEGKLRRVLREETRFGYRFSSFQETNSIIVAAGFQLKKDEGALPRQQEYLEHRRKTQPYKERSAGCVFRNPPGFSAGRLIEEVGLKGTRIGGAEVSSLHANFIVNKENGTAADVKALIQLVQKEVFERKNIALQCEVRLI